MPEASVLDPTSAAVAALRARQASAPTDPTSAAVAALRARQAKPEAVFDPWADKEAGLPGPPVYDDPKLARAAGFAPKPPAPVEDPNAPPTSNRIAWPAGWAPPPAPKGPELAPSRDSALVASPPASNGYQGPARPLGDVVRDETQRALTNQRAKQAFDKFAMENPTLMGGLEGTQEGLREIAMAGGHAIQDPIDTAARKGTAFGWGRGVLGAGLGAMMVGTGQAPAIALREGVRRDKALPPAEQTYGPVGRGIATGVGLVPPPGPIPIPLAGWDAYNENVVAPLDKIAQDERRIKSLGGSTFPGAEAVGEGAALLAEAAPIIASHKAGEMVTDELAARRALNNPNQRLLQARRPGGTTPTEPTLANAPNAPEVRFVDATPDVNWRPGEPPRQALPAPETGLATVPRGGPGVIVPPPTRGPNGEIIPPAPAPVAPTPELPTGPTPKALPEYVPTPGVLISPDTKTAPAAPTFRAKAPLKAGEPAGGTQTVAEPGVAPPPPVVPPPSTPLRSEEGVPTARLGGKGAKTADTAPGKGPRFANATEAAVAALRARETPASAVEPAPAPKAPVGETKGAVPETAPVAPESKNPRENPAPVPPPVQEEVPTISDKPHAPAEPVAVREEAAGTPPTDLPNGVFYAERTLGDGRKVNELRANTADLTVDAASYQHRRYGNKKGLTGRASDVKTWQEPTDPISVWLNPETGTVDVTNGHHRMGIAERSAQTDVPIKFIDAASKAEARFKGFMENLKGGNIDPLDAADYFRAEKFTPEQVDRFLDEHGVTSKTSGVSGGKALAALPDSAWDQYVRQEMKEARAIALGDAMRENGLTEDQKFALLDASAKTPLPELTSLARRIKLAGSESAKPSIGLFGEIAPPKSLVAVEGKLQHGLLEQLAEDKSVMGNVARNADAIKSKGVGAVDRDLAAELRDTSKTLHGQAKAWFKSEARTPLDDFVSETARALDEKRINEEQAAEQLHAKAKEWLEADPITRKKLAEIASRRGPTIEGPPDDGAPSLFRAGKPIQGGGMRRRGGKMEGSLRVPSLDEAHEALARAWEALGEHRAVVDRVVDLANKAVSTGFGTGRGSEALIDAGIAKTPGAQATHDALFMDEFTKKVSPEFAARMRGKLADLREFTDKGVQGLRQLDKALKGLDEDTKVGVHDWLAGEADALPEGLEPKQVEQIKAAADAINELRDEMVPAGALSPEARAEFPRKLIREYEVFKDEQREPRIGAKTSGRVRAYQPAKNSPGLFLKLPLRDVNELIGDRYEPEYVKHMLDEGKYPDSTLVKFATRGERDEFLSDLRAKYGENADKLVAESFDEMSREQEDAMGRSRDPRRQFVRTAQDAAWRASKGNFLNGLAEGHDAKGKWVLDPRSAEATRATRPEGVAIGSSLPYEKLAGKGWGALKDKLVRADVAEQLRGAFGADGDTSSNWHDTGEWFKGAYGEWKSAHVLFNPRLIGRHMANATTQLRLGGMEPLNPENYAPMIESMRRIWTDNEFRTQLVRHGFLDAGYLANEEMGVGAASSKMPQAQRAGRAVATLGLSETKGYRDLKSALGKMQFSPYSAVKAILFDKYLREGMDFDTAAAEVRKFTLDHDTTSEFVKAVSNQPIFLAGGVLPLPGAPFARFRVGMARIFLNAAKEKPVSLAIDLMKRPLVQAAILAATGTSLSDDEKEGMSREHPEAIVTGRDEEGNLDTIDARYLDPWGDFTPRRTKIGESAGWQYIKDATGIGDNPALDLLDRTLSGEDRFGRPTNESGTFLGGIKGAGKQVAQELAPPMTPGVGYEWDKLMSGLSDTERVSTGVPKQTAKQAAADTLFGFKANTVRPLFERGRLANEFLRKRGEAVGKIKFDARRGATPDGDAFNEKMKSLSEELEERDRPWRIRAGHPAERR